jgi:S-adenosylmethionine-diacylglycerol 3-amino-3-carboxypropyl transferase
MTDKEDSTPERISHHADFSRIRYAQCWEDADILLAALDIQPGDTCLTIASAGDNALAMLSQNPQRVIALDLSPAQLACLELRVAAYRVLEHEELLVLIGSRPGDQRQALYQRCRSLLSDPVRDFWDAQSHAIASGIGSIGKFEQYFELFRRYALPLVHSRQRIDRLLQGGTLAERQSFYQQQWDSWRWRLLFRIFFSRWVMGRAGRDPSFFQYVEGTVADRILSRTEYALTQLNPAENPYLQWILTGHHTALPFALRPENFEPIRNNLDRLEWHCCAIEDYLDQVGERAIDRYNLSDIFEYLAPTSYHHLLQRLVQSGRAGGRLAYWNMLAPRSRPVHMADQLKPLTALAEKLHTQDKAFFYSAFIVEEIQV